MPGISDFPPTRAASDDPWPLLLRINGIEIFLSFFSLVAKISAAPSFLLFLEKSSHRPRIIVHMRNGKSIIDRCTKDAILRNF